MYVCMCCVSSWQLRLSFFDTTVLVSEFIAEAILSEWWLLYLSGARCQTLLTNVGTSLKVHMWASLLISKQSEKMHHTYMCISDGTVQAPRLSIMHCDMHHNTVMHHCITVLEAWARIWSLANCRFKTFIHYRKHLIAWYTMIYS